MSRQIVTLGFLGAFLCAWMAGQTAPDRKVEGSLIISKHDPAVEIELPKSAQYVGASRWILYDIAD